MKLRAVRLKAGVSQREVAERAGVSQESIRAYETGRRRPTRERLSAILQALETPAYDANEILEAAGFSTPSSLFPADEYPDFNFSIDELQVEVERVPWPEFVLNNSNEMIAANTAAQALWGVDFAHERSARNRVRLNVLSIASEHQFASRIVNWDEVVATLVSVVKARQVAPASIDEPDPYFSEVLQAFADGEPAFLARLVKVWMATPARDAKVRWGYRVVWRDDEFGEMRFQAIVCAANEPGGLSFNDWQPLDAETWMALERVKARHLGEAHRRA